MSSKRRLIRECCIDCCRIKVSSCSKCPPGAQGPPGPSGVVDVFFEGSNDSIQPIDSIALILPPITVLPGQIVELDAFATATLRSTILGTPYAGVCQLLVSRNGDFVTQALDGIDSIPKATGSTITTICNPSLIWVDRPLPGTYIYILNIGFYFSSVNEVSSELSSRGLRAKVYNTP